MKTEEFKKKQSEMSNEALIGLAKDTISKMAESYGKAHKMTIPPSITDTDMLLSELIKRFEQYSQQNYTPYQLCPKCNGDGDLARYNSPSITSLCPVCDVCNGAKIIPMSLI